MLEVAHDIINICTLLLRPCSNSQLHGGWRRHSPSRALDFLCHTLIPFHMQRYGAESLLFLAADRLKSFRATGQKEKLSVCPLSEMSSENTEDTAGADGSLTKSESEDGKRRRRRTRRKRRSGDHMHSSRPCPSPSLSAAEIQACVCVSVCVCASSERGGWG